MPKGRLRPAMRGAWVAVLAVLAGAIIFVGKAPIAHAGAVVSDIGCTAHVLSRNDDDYSDPVPIGFDVFFGNQFHSNLRISTDGFVAFSPTVPPVWWMLRQWEAFNIPVIAGFHADIDTRAPGTTPVTYGPITFGGHPALCINWVNVGYFDSRDDLLNSLQLILVNRSDTGAGDVDIYLNYDHIEWDTTTNGSVVKPRAGIYDGTTVLHELPGSNQTSTLIDGAPDALNGNSVGSAVIGRYVFPLHSGLPPLTSVITGEVLDANGAPVAGAPVQACGGCIGVGCVLGTTNSQGHYELTGFADGDTTGCETWEVEVSPPAGSLLLRPPLLEVTFTASDQVIADADVQLKFPETIPSGTTITPSSGGGFGGVPRVFWQSPLVLSTQGCPSVVGETAPIAVYMVAQDDNHDLARCVAGPSPADPTLVRCGTMAEATPPAHSGLYTAEVAPFAPVHGTVTITMGLTCPKDPSDPNPAPSGTSSFTLYIDPSGWVQTVAGVPLIGALVTLYRSESPMGPFDIVPAGSALMAPENRTNPDHTDSAGHFAWDTIAGYYVVRAEYPGCVSPDNPAQTFVETDVLAVPPAWTDLHLYLDCGAIAPPQLGLPLEVAVSATSTAGAVATYTASANDERDGPVPVSCAPPSGGQFAVGATTVTCSASNAVGNVASGSFPVHVSYAWSNVLAPLRPGAGNRFERGRTIPVRFALTGPSARIKNLVAHLYVAAVIGGVPGPELPARSERHGHDGPVFRYESCDHDYQFDWSTYGLSAGHYQIRIDLGDGVSHLVPIKLKK
ncbi:MAG: nidogen-like domain-containing protein [Kofleriaceae bacterium]